MGTFKVGDIISVAPHTLYKRTMQNDMTPRKHQGYDYARVSSVLDIGQGQVSLEIEVDGGYDEVDAPHCTLLDSRGQRVNIYESANMRHDLKLLFNRMKANGDIAMNEVDEAKHRAKIVAYALRLAVNS